MSLPKIPAGLCVAAQGYGFGGPTGARRTDIAAGRGRYGLNYYGGTSQFAVTLVLTDDQMRIWSLFYHRKIALGTLPFALDLDSGLGVQPHECNITPDSYQAALNQTVWIVSFNIEAKASAYEYDQEVADLEIEYWDNTSQFLGPMLDRLTIFANSDVLILNRVRPNSAGGPYLDFNFAATERIDPRVILTRPSSATCFGPDRLLRTVGPDTPRLDYDPATGKCRGLLVEPSATNILKYSAGDSGAAQWARGPNMTRVGKDEAPDGSNGATIYRTSAIGNAYIGQQVQSFAANTKYALSCYAKLRTGSVVPTAGDIITVDYDSNGVPGTPERATLPFAGSGISYEWKRFSLTIQNVAAIAGNVYFLTDFTVGPEVVLWGCQVEVGEVATSYVPTEASSTTRAADTARVALTNFNQSQGTVLFDLDVANMPPVGDAFRMSDGTNDNLLGLRVGSLLGNGMDLYGRSGGADFVDAAETPFSTNTPHRSIMKFKTGDTGFSLDGRAVIHANSATFPVAQAFNTLSLGAGVVQRIGRLALYDRALTDAEMRLITS